MKIKSLLFGAVFATLSLFVCPSARAVTFSGYAGIKGDVTQDASSDSIDPELSIQSYFAAQFDFSSDFLIRTEFSIRTDDIINTGLFEDTEAIFCIDELSATYIKPFLGITQYFSLFVGTFEPIGSDVFLQRHFGIKPIASLITENWLGLKGSTVYPFYGVGASYVIQMNAKPVATGIYIYKNDENEEEENQINLDLRFSSATNFFSVDLAAGIGAPLNTKNGSEDVILLIDTLYLHTGIDVLIGNNYSNALFVQAGFDNLPIKAEDDVLEIDADDVYLLVEPRLYTQKYKAHLSMFSLPEKTVEKLVFVEDTFGFNLSIFTEKLYIKNKDFTFGFHTTVSFPDKNFYYAIKHTGDLFSDDVNYKISPFVSFKLLGGIFKTMLQVKLNQMNGDDWQNAVKLNLGFKAQL